jgi:hypothetical protein
VPPVVLLPEVSPIVPPVVLLPEVSPMVPPVVPLPEVPLPMVLPELPVLPVPVELPVVSALPVELLPVASDPEPPAELPVVGLLVVVPVPLPVETALPLGEPVPAPAPLAPAPPLPCAYALPERARHAAARIPIAFFIACSPCRVGRWTSRALLTPRSEPFQGRRSDDVQTCEPATIRASDLPACVAAARAARERAAMRASGSAALLPARRGRAHRERPWEDAWR